MIVFWQDAGIVIVAALIQPVFWLLSLSISLWLGRKFLSDKWGRRLFGHFWNRSHKSIFKYVSGTDDAKPRGRLR